MDQRTEVEVTALHTAPNHVDEYLVTLSAKSDTSLELVMQVGKSEAQMLAITLENMHPTAPFPIDVLENAIVKFGYTVKEACILDLVDGIYTARICCLKDDNIVDLTARPAEAMTIALKFEAPIFVKADLMTRR